MYINIACKLLYEPVCNKADESLTTIFVLISDRKLIILSNNILIFHIN